jgi:hypothetical protein
MASKRFCVYKIIGEFALDKAQGAQVHDTIERHLAKAQSLDVDFIGIRITSCVFWAYAITPFLDRYSSEELNHKIRILGLKNPDKDKLSQAINNKKETIRIKS